MIHAFHALNVQLVAAVDFEWVPTDANIADLPSRGDFALLEEMGSVEVPFRVPPFDGGWLTPDEASAAAGLGPSDFSDPLPRGGGRRRGKSVRT